MSDVLRSTEDLTRLCEELVQPTGVERLDVIPCGPKPPDPAELLGNSRLIELIAWADASGGRRETLRREFAFTSRAPGVLHRASRFHRLDEAGEIG